MKRIQNYSKPILVLILVQIFFLFSPQVKFAQALSYPTTVGKTPIVEANTAYLLEQETGEMLFDKKGNDHIYPASTTKVLTALLALEYGDLNEVITIGNEVLFTEKDGSSAGIRIGMKIPLRDLVYGIMLPSGNDASFVTACYIARKIEKNPTMQPKEAIGKFVDLMNNTAKELGANDSNFINPDGYHDDKHYTTAHDMALIAREAMKYDLFRKVVKTTQYRFENNVPNIEPKVLDWLNRNKLIQLSKGYYYEFATGIKTGTTSRSGCCLVSSADKNGFKVIGVIMGSSKSGRWEDAIKILDFGLNNFELKSLSQKGDVIRIAKVKTGMFTGLLYDEEQVTIKIPDNLKAVVYNKDKDKVKSTIVWENGVIDYDAGTQDEFWLNAPICKDQKLGKIVYTIDNHSIGELILVPDRDIPLHKDRLIIILFMLSCVSVIIIILIVRRLYLLRKKYNQQNMS